MLNMNDDLFERLFVEVKRICGDEASHGVCHAMRTFDFACRIAKVEGGDMVVIGAAAILHDIGRKNIFGDTGHGLRGAKMADGILRGLKADIDVEKVVEIIGKHDEPGEDIQEGQCGGEPLELSILRDADRLELLRISPDYLELERLVTDEALRLVPYVLSLHYPKPEDKWMLDAMERTRRGAEAILKMRGLQ